MSDKTCAERIGAHLEGRETHIKSLQTMSSVDSEEEVSELIEHYGADILADYGLEVNEVPETIRDTADMALWEFPLAVTRKVLIRIDLSTGGPADWLEAVMDPDDFELDRVTYHFADWFDHAETEVSAGSALWEYAASVAESMMLS